MSQAHTTESATMISIARRINAEGELRLPRNGRGGADVPVLQLNLPSGVEPWWRKAYGQWRLRMEGAAMQRFPGFRLIRHDNDLHWVGTLRCRVNTPRGERNRRYLVRVSYPGAFPVAPPTVTIEKPNVPAGAPHQLELGQPCLFYPGDGASHGYDRARTTAATLVSWTALWLHALEVWRTTGRWPGSEI